MVFEAGEVLQRETSPRFETGGAVPFLSCFAGENSFFLKCRIERNDEGKSFLKFEF